MSPSIETTSSPNHNEYDFELIEFRQSLVQFKGSEDWMNAILQNWLHIPTPHPWQIEHSLHLFWSQEVFITSKTGSSKSVLTLAPVIARKIAKKSHMAFAIYPTEALIIDQVKAVPLDCWRYTDSMVLGGKGTSERGLICSGDL